MHNSFEHNSILDEHIENRTNRQLCKTLVFKGIPEMVSDFNSSDNENDSRIQAAANNNMRAKKESWDDTEINLAKHISEICSMPVQEAKKIIERCHRSNPNPNYQGTGPRPIFAAFHSWKDSEWIKSEFRKNNIDNPGCHIYAEQKFGPKTTIRRNRAMLMRKRLKDDREIISGYVAYPARLMVKTSNGEKYIMKKDFSKEEVNFR